MVALGLSLSGCTWQTADAEHHFGPVLFRHSTPSAGEGVVGQTLRFGIAVEGGRSWGLALGVSERTVVAPVEVPNRRAAAPSGRVPRWITAWGSSADVSAGGWHLSPFYLRVERLPNTFFVARTSYGFEAVAGQEINALAVGFARRTLFTPPGDAVALLHFQSRQPLAARARVWRVGPGSGILPHDLFEEIAP